MPSESVQREIDAFKNSIEPFLDQWRSLDVRVVAIKEKGKGDSPFQNAAGTIRFSPLPPQEAELQVNLPNLPWLKAIHEVRPIEELDAVLSRLTTSGTLRVGEVEVTLNAATASASFQKNQKGEGYSFSPKDWTYYSLMVDTRFAVSFDPRRTDEELKAADSPWLSLDELIQEFPSWRWRWGNLRGLLEISAAFGIRIAETRWEDGKLRLVVDRMPSWHLKDLDLGLIYHFPSGLKERKSQEVETQTFSPGGKLDIDLKLPGDVTTVTTLLRTKRTAVDQTTAYRPGVNPRLGLYEIFDKNLEQQRLWLSVEGEGAPDFEKAIQTLLFLCGYSVVPFVGHFKERGRIDIRGVDCLASEAGGNILVVECTTGPIDSDKMEKLRHRNNSLRNLGYSGTPVLFTSATRESISKDVMKKAQGDKISIVAREDIDKLLSMAKRNAHLDEISPFIYQCIPSSFPTG